MAKKNPIVFLEVSIGNGPAERMVFELFADVAPKSAENFRALCTGEMGVGQYTGKPLHYKGTIFHRIIEGFMAQGGDFSKRDGTGGESIYGGKFADEEFVLSHGSRGLLSMANAGPDTNGSQFFITFKPAPHLNGKHVVFGKLISGSETLKRMEHADADSERTTIPVKVVDCGELTDGKGHVSGTIENDKRKTAKGNLLMDAHSSDDSHEGKHKGRRKKPSKGRKKRKRRRYSSESDNSTESETSDCESDSDSYSSDSTDISSSSDDRRRKKQSRKEKHKHGKRKRDQKREKRRRKREKKLKHKSKRTSESFSEAEDGISEGDKLERKQHTKAHDSSLDSDDNQKMTLPADELNADLLKGRASAASAKDDMSLPENGAVLGIGCARSLSGQNVDNSAIMIGNTSKSRSQSISANRSMSKSMSISPRHSPIKIAIMSLKKPPSRSPAQHWKIGDTMAMSGRNVSVSPPRSFLGKDSPAESLQPKSPSTSLKMSPVRGLSRSPVAEKRSSISRGSVRSPVRKVSVSPTEKRNSNSHRSVRSARSFSGSPRRAPARRNPGVSPSGDVWRSLGKSPIKLSRRSVSRSPVRGRTRKSVSRSPNLRRVASPPSRGSLSRSASPNGSPKRIRRGRGFSQRYSYARRYRTPSPDRSPVRSYRYGGRNDRDRYPSYRGYNYRSPPPRRYRSSPRGRTPPRYRARRSRSISGSPARYRDRTRARAYSKTPSLAAEKPRLDDNREQSASKSSSLSGSRSRSGSLYSPSTGAYFGSPEHADKKSRSPSSNSGGKGGLVLYGDGQPDSAAK